ncbi:hypothetical protein FT663_04267 [Candidozyma haemuli var. vulneris]|uniref:Ribosomal protein L22 n=1 Tax=Candidozyma haemuli TaxID=45357 RepID=A0A2V1APZ2_9ASCO|nr:hypothetical protein CXQ85_003632 [[Candida] haemuloni]KAF3986765.1 hypothetical protein FT662_04375 [[Candida] haemuloni var. vulneris]KAF3987874.1 hypothetical protein FT663_04267 [[Candida] haemuloni var. vulneris]PVH19774.1 hypothetical protein CXQ85_003632 [[Candida] haemuloni]
MFRQLGWISARAGHVLRTSSPLVSQPSIARSLHSTSRPFAQGSLFGSITEEEPEAPAKPEEEAKTGEKPLPKDDKPLQEHYLKEVKEKQLSSDKFVSPLKRRLFALNVEQNGFFKNEQYIRDPESNKTYKVSLTGEEIDILEPTVYIKSYRIKSSMKKATVVNRFVRGYNVKTAINQLHFNPKKMSTELEKFLKRALGQAKEVGIDEDEAFIQALWVGSDGGWIKRPDIKGRGRTGVIHHPYVHLKAILKGSQTKQRIAWEKAQKQLAAKPKSLLNNEPLNFKVHSYYRW